MIILSHILHAYTLLYHITITYGTHICIHASTYPLSLMYLSVEYGGEGVRDLVGHLKGKLRNDNRVWNTNVSTVQVHLNNIGLGIKTHNHVRDEVHVYYDEVL